MTGRKGLVLSRFQQAGLEEAPLELFIMVIERVTMSERKHNGTRKTPSPEDKSIW